MEGMSQQFENLENKVGSIQRDVDTMKGDIQQIKNKFPDLSHAAQRH